MGVGEFLLEDKILGASNLLEFPQTCPSSSSSPPPSRSGYPPRLQ